MRPLLLAATALALLAGPAGAQMIGAGPFQGGTISLPLTAPGITSTGNASVAGTLGTTNLSTITAGSGSNSQIVLTPAASGSVPIITGVGTGGIKITGQGGAPVYVGGSSPAIFGNGFTYNVGNAAVIPQLQQSFNISGTATGNPALIYSGGLFILNSDTLQLPNANQGFNGWQFEHSLAAGFTGNRHALEVSLIQGGTSGNTLASGTIGYYTSILGYSVSSVNDNGTGLTSTTAHGRAFAGNLNAELHSGATNYFQATALELNAQIDTGASALVRDFLSISPVAGAVQGSQVDAGIWFYSAGGALIKTGILFGSGGLNQWPIDPAGTLIGTDAGGGVTAQAAHGIYLAGVAFTVDSWNDGHIQFTGAGDALMNSATPLVLSATSGFLHLPNTSGVPTGTPSNTTPGCEWNTVSHTLNCYDGASWYHFASTAGAG